MKWKDLFDHPDQVGETAYEAVHNVVAEAIYGTDRPDPDTKVSQDGREMLESVLGGVQYWVRTIQERCGKVVICVRGGVAEVVGRPENVTVEILDCDTEGCESSGLDSDGAMISVFGRSEE